MITEANYAEVEKARLGSLEIGAEDYYFKTLRPYMQDMMRTCKTDPELYRTLDKVINATDGLCTHKKYQEIIDELAVLQKVITDVSYFNNGAIKRASEEEKNKVRDLISKVSDFIMIIKCEPPYTPTETKTRERLDYQPAYDNSPNGENMGYREHNMKNLTKPIPQKRIPNV
jgi:hypothetical protein